MVDWAPDQAASWAETFTDDNRRFSQVESVARRWIETDRASAEAWLNRTDLPDDCKRGLLTPNSP